MKSAIFFSAAALVASVAGLTVNTPGSVVECEPTAITWTGGTAPFYLSFALQTDPNGAAQQSYGPLTSSPFTWTTNITANIDLIINLKDNTGTVAQSGSFIVQSGSTSCLTSSGSSSAASGSGSSSSAAAGSSASTGASTGGSASTSAASSGHASTSASGTSSGSGAATTSPTSGALANAANVFAAAVVGAGVVAYLA
ncbi:hypothetical protein FOMPIDRAFT_1021364 [Fomitopsis schrenkii]|uniref:Uncharacterized protein n=1 Tax=Fomitopsis schrenkii TaxID=2126942 RepID=S8EK77_FOMSC|nr:hypothetical protein FOMPIDRAFT_1021364 [Fomitopsis schrenkii]